MLQQISLLSSFVFRKLAATLNFQSALINQTLSDWPRPTTSHPKINGYLFIIFAPVITYSKIIPVR